MCRLTVLRNGTCDNDNISTHKRCFEVCFSPQSAILAPLFSLFRAKSRMSWESMLWWACCSLKLRWRPYSADVIKVDVKVSQRLPVLIERTAFIIECFVHTKLLLEPHAFLVWAGDSDDFCAHVFAKLACERADRSCCTRDNQSFTFFELADVLQALKYGSVRNKERK